jgi:beta-alanine degradation protein BauB
MAVQVLVPWITKLLIENDRVKVYESSQKPGEKLEMHEHPDFIVYPLTDSEVRFTYKDGTTKEMKFKKGEAAFSKSQWHAVENIGNSESRLLAIELKY